MSRWMDSEGSLQARLAPHPPLQTDQRERRRFPLTPALKPAGTSSCSHAPVCFSSSGPGPEARRAPSTHGTQEDNARGHDTVCSREAELKKRKERKERGTRRNRESVKATYQTSNFRGLLGLGRSVP